MSTIIVLVASRDMRCIKEGLSFSLNQAYELIGGIGFIDVVGQNSQSHKCMNLKGEFDLLRVKILNQPNIEG